MESKLLQTATRPVTTRQLYNDKGQNPATSAQAQIERKNCINEQWAINIKWGHKLTYGQQTDD